MLVICCVYPNFGQGSCLLQGSWSSEDGEGAFTKAVLARETRMAVQGQLDPLALLQALQVRPVCPFLRWQMTTMGVRARGTKHVSPMLDAHMEKLSRPYAREQTGQDCRTAARLGTSGHNITVPG